MVPPSGQEWLAYHARSPGETLAQRRATQLSPQAFSNLLQYSQPISDDGKAPRAADSLDGRVGTDIAHPDELDDQTKMEIDA